MGKSKNLSSSYSYYFDNFECKPYDFTDKERCIREYMIYMLDRTQRMFEYKGLPDTIPKRMLEFLLQINGFACFTKVKGELYAFYGGLGGEPDVYYRPTICNVSSPALDWAGTLKIGTDCIIVRNDSFMRGLVPLYQRYATAMVENDLSFKLATINTRIQSLISAPDDTTKAAGEKYLQDVADGKLGVIASNEFLEGIKVQPNTSTLRTFTDLIEYQQYLKASWYNEIGLNANYNMKREKLSTTESQMNNDALLPLVDDMLESRQKCLEEVNALFGTNITVDFASSWEKLLQEFEEESIQLDKEGVETDGNGETDSGLSVESSDVSGGQTDSYESAEPDSGPVETSREDNSDSGESADVEVRVEIEVNADGESNSDTSVSEDTSESGDSDDDDRSSSGDSSMASG